MTGYSKRITEASNPKILRAAREMSKILKQKGIAHALIGGLAVAAYGYKRATGDADFLISGDAQDQLAGDMLGGEVHGKTIVFKGVVIDLLFPSREQGFLEAEIQKAHTKNNNGIPTISQEALVYMKLIASRMKDNADIVELLKRGKIDKERVVKYLEKHRPDLVEDFEALALQAEHEPD